MNRRLLAPGRAREFARFVVVGCINTAVGFAVYLLLLPLMGYQPAYATTYVIGILVAYLLNSIFVFRSRISLRTAVRYPLVYLVQYLFGALLLFGLVAGLGLDRRWAALIALILSVPISYTLNRIVLTRRARP